MQKPGAGPGLGCSMSHLPPWAIAAFLQPFVLLVLSVCVFWPVKVLIRRRMKDGKLKRLLLRPIGKKP